MNSNLPRPVMAFLAAERAKESAALARCFTDDGIVRDEGREHRGAVEIEAWHREANTKDPYVVEAIDASIRASTVTVHTRVSGAFPGSPADLRNHFTLKGDRISHLEVKP